MKQKLLFLSLGFALPILILAALALHFGGVGSAMSWLNGKPFHISPSECRLGKQSPGTEVTVTFSLKNLSGNKLSVSGFESNCSCVFTEEIPATISPKETVRLHVQVRFPESGSAFNQTVVFLITTPDKTLKVPAQITASLVPSQNEEAGSN